MLSAIVALVKTKALEIQLENLQQPDWHALYVGARPRYATATSVRLLDAHTLICCSLLARKIYLIRFDLASKSFSVLDSADTVYDGSTTQTDLCDIDGLGRVVTSNCEDGNMSLYRIEGDKIRHERDLATGLTGNFCHGARFCGPDKVVATALREPCRGAHFYEVSTLRKLLYVRTPRLAKDLCFLPDGRAVLATTDSAPSSAASSGGAASELLVARVDLKRGTYDVTGRQTYDVGQIDSVVYYGAHLYVSDSHGGRVLVVDPSTLRVVEEVGGYDFPHGVDVNYGVLAVACYGTNTIHLMGWYRD